MGAAICALTDELANAAAQPSSKSLVILFIC
jgi:hypothetical protein